MSSITLIKRRPAKGRRNNNGNNNGSGGNKPPQIKSNIVLRHRYRFTSSNITTTAITANSVLCAAGSYGTAVNATVKAFFQSGRIRDIKIWSPPSAQGSSTTCSVEWIGNTQTFGNNLEVSDTSVSVSTPAFIRTKPPKNSLASFWFNSASGSLCSLTAPVGSIIDVHLDLIASDGESIPAGQATEAAAAVVVGTVYYMSLDSNATHYYTPVSLTTTT